MAGRPGAALFLSNVHSLRGMPRLQTRVTGSALPRLPGGADGAAASSLLAGWLALCGWLRGPSHNHFPSFFFIVEFGTSLVVQWLRLVAHTQGSWVQSLVEEPNILHAAYGVAKKHKQSRIYTILPVVSTHNRRAGTCREI